MKNAQLKNIEFIFGGSFDPIHLGHLNVIKHLQTLKPDCSIRVMPCSLPALKQPLKASFEQRIVMLKLALLEFDNIIIDPREGNRKGKSFSITSLQELKSEELERNLVMVLGEDSLLTLKNWHLNQLLTDFCHIIVVNRPGKRVENLSVLMSEINFIATESIHQLELTASGSYYCLMIDEKAIASSEIKQRLSNKESVDGMLSAQVKQYITKNSLY